MLLAQLGAPSISLNYLIPKRLCLLTSLVHFHLCLRLVSDCIKDWFGVVTGFGRALSFLRVFWLFFWVLSTLTSSSRKARVGLNCILSSCSPALSTLAIRAALRSDPEIFEWQPSIQYLATFFPLFSLASAGISTRELSKP